MRLEWHGQPAHLQWLAITYTAARFRADLMRRRCPDRRWSQPNLPTQACNPAKLTTMSSRPWAPATWRAPIRGRLSRQFHNLQADQRLKTGIEITETDLNRY